MSWFDAAVIAQCLASLILIAISISLKRKEGALYVLIGCFFYWMWDNSGLSKSEIIEEVIKAGQRHGLPVKMGEPIDVEDDEWKF